MGRGSSKAGGGGGGGAAKKQPPRDMDEAFAPGVDFEASGDVNHDSRWASSNLQRQWDAYADQFGPDPSYTDENLMFKDWDPATDSLYGYFRTTNSFKINEALYDPKNAGKTDSEIFTRKDRRGNLRDLQTVQALDRAINSHKTPSDGAYTRFCGSDALQATFGLTNAQMKMLTKAPSMSADELAQLNLNLSGSKSYNKAYTSFSANRSANAFSNPGKKQSRGFMFERRVSIPKGTKAYAPKRNAQESEVLFGRKMETRLTHVTVEKGHIVLHEAYVGYK